MNEQTIIDISRDLIDGMAVWPGDTPFQMERTLMMSRGDSVNVTTLTLSSHSGSHVDAPYHCREDGTTVDRLPLLAYWGPAQVVTVARPEGPLTPADFAAYDLSLAPRLLVRSPASDVDPRRFPERFPYPTPELAHHLGRRSILLYGTDAPSMDEASSKSLPGHNALLQHDIAILEGLSLAHVADGLYELAALPLKLSGGDGSPVRAALRPLAKN